MPHTSPAVVFVVAATLLPSAVQALLPGNGPEDIEGVWRCGENNGCITKLGSIEVLGDG